MKYRIEYTDNLKDWQGATCSYPWYPKWGTCVIRIRPKYIDDVGIRKHEIEHARQYSDDFFHALKYSFLKSYRYKCELQAYKMQIQEYRYTDIKQCGWIVDALEKKYNLSIDRVIIEQDVEKLL